MVNNTMFQFFHWFFPQENHLWQHIMQEAAHIKDLGITSVWLPPAYKSSKGAGSMGYDAYDLYDLGEFDQKGSVATRFGTKDEYLQAIKILHDNGIQVYADIVLNHKAGADEAEEVMAHKVNPDDRNEVISEAYKIKAFTKFNFPGRQGKYSDFMWDYHCFSGVDWDDDKKEKAIFKILNEYGENWEALLGDERGNFDYLMFADTEFRNPAVREEFTKWALWYLETTGVDGFRLDAVKHITHSFFPDWLNAIRTKTNKELFTVGENATTFEVIQKYQEVTNACMSLFDFPLQRNFHAASFKGAEYDLRQIFNETLTQSDPTHSVTFVDNHDTQLHRNLEIEVKPWFRPHAYALILLREAGYPCVFYPDIYGIEIHKKEEDGEEKNISVSPCAPLEKMLLARKQYAYGNQRDYFEQAGLIGWIRGGNDDPASGLAVVISNKDEGSIEMEVGKKFAGRTFFEITETRQDTIEISDEGKAQFPVNAGSVSVWVPK